jgi:hypothetical protein
MKTTTRQLILAISFILLPSSFILCLSGCNVMGVAANALPLPTIQAEYKGLAGQSVGVLVWADRGIAVDWPSLSLDTAQAIQTQLQQIQHNSPKMKELTGTTFPVKPASIVRYLRDHPELDNTDVKQVAPRFGVQRLIYVEIDDFSTRAAASVELYRGTLNGAMKIVEVDASGQPRIVYEENDIKVVFPPKAAEDGEVRGNDAQYYVGTVKEFATHIVWRVVPHQEEEP